jgi:hypothetical protein
LFQSTATFDILNILRRELAELTPGGRVPAGTVAALSDISSGKMSQYLNGTIKCPIEHEVRLRKTWTGLKRLIELCRPIPINYAKTGELKQSLIALENRELHILIFDDNSEPVSDESEKDTVKQ